MTDFIVDASIVADFLVVGNYTANAERLLQSMNGTMQLFVPEFCFVECTNVLWKRVRFENMPQARAEQLASDLHLLPLTLVSVKSLYTRALQIGLAHKLAIYDSVYIALAEKRKYSLITGDIRQGEAARTVGVTIKPITDF